MKTIFFVVFLIWGLPMMKYRSQFRKIVYQTDDWKINIQPRFGKEFKGLFTNLYPENPEYLKVRNFYLFYLGVYVFLFVLWRYSN